MGLALALLAATASGAGARPAVVRVFEAKVHADASANARVVGVLVEGQRVSVSEQAQAGWHRIRLADGTTAWVQVENLFLPEALPVGSAPPAAAGSTAGGLPPGAPGSTPGAIPVGVPTAHVLGLDPSYGLGGVPTAVASGPGSTAGPAHPPAQVTDPHLGLDPDFRRGGSSVGPDGNPLALDPQRIGPPVVPARYIDDFDLLADAVGPDPAFSLEVEAMQRDTHVARWFFWGGLGAAVLLAAVPFSIYTAQGESMPPVYAYSAGGLLLVSSVGTLLYEPGTEEMERLARKWNVAHPEAPLSVGEPPR